MKVSKLVTFVLNIVLAAICCMAIVGYIIGPVWEIEATFTINQDVIDKVVEMTSADATDESDPIVGILNQMSVDDVKLPVKLSLSTKAVYGSLLDKNGSSVDNLIDDAVDAAFSDEVVGEAEKLKKSATKGATKSLVAQAMEELKQTDEYKNEFGDKKVEEVLAEAGIDEKTLDDKVDLVYNALSSGNSVDKASDEIVDVIADIFDAVKESDFGKENPDVFKDYDLRDGELKDNVVKTLVCLLENADGNAEVKSLDDVTDEMIAERLESTIDLGDVIDKYLLQLINGELGDIDFSEITAKTDGKSPAVKTNSLSFTIGGENPVNLSDRLYGDSTVNSSDDKGGAPSASTAENTEKTTVEEIKATVKQNLKESVPAEAKTVFVTVMRVFAVVLLLWMSVWVFFLIMLVINTASGKMSTKLKWAIIFGWGPALLIVVIPTLIFKVFTTNNFITQAVFAGNVAALDSFSKIVTLSFSSGTMLALIATLAVIAISIPYMIFRKK